MKVRKLFSIDKNLFERLQKVCDDNGFYRSSFVCMIIKREIDLINGFDESPMRVHRKGAKAKFQIRIEEEDYDKIKGNKTQRLEKILDLVLTEYEKGKQRY